MASVFITGFPGFLGSELIERLLSRYPPEAGVNCLVQPAYRALAEQRAREIEARCDVCAGRIQLYEGDITRPDLGLGDQYRVLAEDTVEIYHLAAAYDLGVRRDFAMRVNLAGTRNMLEFASRCRPHLVRFQYISTCYVSGRYPGVFEEGDLVKGQSFNNYYEETKYLAEVEVQRCMAEGLPATIYRPAVVVGESQSGETQKYDGVYYLFQLLLRQPRVALVPVFADPSRFEMNLVPCDFVVESLLHLSELPQSLGKVYQLCDPQPLTIDRLIEVSAEATGRRAIRVRLPKSPLKSAMLHLPGVVKVFKVEPATLDYFVHPTHYTCENTLEDLAGTGIHCPPFESYVENLVRFMKAHPEVSPKAMV